jgi:hypothetical protein
MGGYAAMRQQTDRNYAAWVDWVSEGGWDVCGTLNFAKGRKLYGSEADKVFRAFWKAADRLAYGQNGYGIERRVFTHHGAIGDNKHLHFVAKAPFEPEEFCIRLNALYASFHTHTAPPADNEILPIISKRHACGYALHDFWKIESETFNHELSRDNARHEQSQLRDQPITPHPDAAARFKKATSSIWTLRARMAFDDHVKLAAARYERRHGLASGS